MAKRKRHWVKWLLGTDSNMMNALNLMGLAITTYGVMYVLPQNNINWVLGMSSLGFIILGLFQFIISVVNLCGGKNE
ncbi:hypothetical protein HYV84_03870 [Candidatus Woesearchaeota archaeon]|nr:hypothetical protein [Candidatus Woesearchaeota archaeon]